MCSGDEFDAAESSCEKARSPNLVRSYGSEKSVDDVDLRRLYTVGVHTSSKKCLVYIPDLFYVNEVSVRVFHPSSFLFCACFCLALR